MSDRVSPGSMDGLFARSVQAAARRPRVIRGVAWVLTIGFAAGLSRVSLRTDVFDWLPRSQPQAAAFRRAATGIEGVTSQELLWLELDEDRARAKGIESITDHGAFLAQEELVRYLEARAPGMEGVMGALTWLRAAVYVLGGHDPERARVPESPFAFRAAWGLIALDATASGAMAPLIGDGSPPRGTLLTLRLAREDRVAATLALERALGEYVRDPSVQWDVFRHEHLALLGLTSGARTIDEHIARDVVRLGPVAIAALWFVLWLGLGSWRRALASVVVVAIGTAWTLGAMGWVGAPLDVISIIVLPLLLGTGVNCAVVIAVDLDDRRRAGVGREAAIAEISRGAAPAVALTVLTTIVGLAALAFADVPGLTRLGTFGALGMAFVGALALWIWPAVVVRADPGGATRFGSIATAGARVASCRPLTSLGLLVGLLVLAGTWVRSPRFELDVIDGNYPEGSPIVVTAHRVRERCGGAFPEFFVFEGDQTSPAAETARRDVAAAVRSSPVLARFVPLGLDELVRGHEMGRVLEGAAPRPLGDVVPALEVDRVWGPVAGMILAPDRLASVVYLLGGDAGTTLESVRVVWDEMAAISDRVSTPEVSCSFLGFRTMSYLFATFSLESLRFAGLATFVVVVALAILFFRRLAIVVLIAGVVLASSLLWYLLLQWCDVYLSVFLLFPLIFALSMASDYALHLICRWRQERESGSEDAIAATWRSTGRAVLIAAATDGVVFLTFSAMELVSAKIVLRSVALAIVAAFVITQWAVPATLGWLGGRQAGSLSPGSGNTRTEPKTPS